MYLAVPLVPSNLHYLRSYLRDVEAQGDRALLNLQLGAISRHPFDFIDLLDTWLRRCDPTWLKLAAALHAIGYPALANQIYTGKRKDWLSK